MWQILYLNLIEYMNLPYIQMFAWEIDKSRNFNQMKNYRWYHYLIFFFYNSKISLIYNPFALLGRKAPFIHNSKINHNPFIILTFLSSTIPFSTVTSRSFPAYGVYMSQLIWYSRTCNSYQDFLHRSVLLTKKLLVKVS